MSPFTVTRCDTDLTHEELERRDRRAAGLRLAQLMLRPASDDLALEVEVVADALEQRQRPRHAVGEGDRVLYGKFDGTSVKYCGEDHQLIKDDGTIPASRGAFTTLS